MTVQRVEPGCLDVQDNFHALLAALNDLSAYCQPPLLNLGKLVGGWLRRGRLLVITTPGARTPISVISIIRPWSSPRS